VTPAARLSVHPLSPTIGAEIAGVDLSVPLDPDVVAAIRHALNTHHVVFFRQQSLTAEQQADFARQFGQVTEAHPVLPSIAENREVLAIDGQVDRANWWHSDITFLDTPAMGSILYMLEAPEVGGDTMWASLQDAYDGLAPGVRTLCDGLIAIHHDPWFAADVDARGGYEWNGTWREKLVPALHPVVRTHPETGRNGLFVNGQFTQMLLGLTQNESTSILEMLYRHCVQPEYTCRFRWQKGSVAFWDNRATLHYALDDYGDATRYAHRVTLRGDRPFGPAVPARDDG
jgi:alpha-ketoglutarate-dependent taurine dioxygenase